MKLITVKVNEGFDHVINFDSPKSLAPKEFVVESFANKVPLLTFYPKDENNTGANLFFYQSDEDEVDIRLRSIKPANELQISNDGECVDVVLEARFDTSIDDDKDEDEDYDDLDDRDWDASRCTYSLNLPDLGSSYRIKVNVVLAIEDAADDRGKAKGKGKTRERSKNKQREYTSSFIINVAPSANIFDAVLDFGSEASQVLVYWRGNDKIGNNLFPIYSGFKKYFGEDATNDDEVLQYEHKNNSLYKSHFFIPKVIDTSVTYNPAACPKDIQLMKFYTPLTEMDELRTEYVTLHNVKIAAYGGVKPPQVKSATGNVIPVKGFQKNYFYRASVNSFVYQILEAVADDMQAPQPRFVVLYALVPNVYSQSEVSAYLNALRGDAQAMIDSDQRLKDVIKGISISSVSESDASFLGFLSACPVESNTLVKGEYLIMDAGKGTLDFSIIDFDQNRTQSVKGVYRSGIVGAGNAITYAFLLAILAQIYSGVGGIEADREALIAAFIKNKVHGSDECEVYKLMSLVEQYKRLYNDNALKNDWISVFKSKNTELELTGLINSLNENIKNLSKLQDDSIIEAMMEKIADDAIAKLAYHRVDNMKQVIFTGRGFMMKSFKDKMMEKLKALDGYSDLKEITIDEKSASMKSICLFLLPYLIQDRYDGLMVGSPDILHHGDAALTKPQDKVEKRYKPKKKKGKSWSKVFASFLGDNGASGGDIYLQADNNYINGVELSAKTTLDKIMISGNFYQLKNMQQGKLKVFFDGETFLARQESRLLSFSPSVDIQQRMAYESMFPYAECDGDIPIPHLQVYDKDKTTKKSNAAVAVANPHIADSKNDGNNELSDDELAAKLKGGK